MIKMCNTQTGISDKMCKCINSDLIKYKYNPLCEDLDCIKYGYQTSAMTNALSSLLLLNKMDYTFKYCENKCCRNKHKVYYDPIRDQCKYFPGWSTAIWNKYNWYAPYNYFKYPFE